MQPIATHEVAWSVCLLIMNVCRAKMAELIGKCRTQGTKERCVGCGPDSPMGIMNWWFCGFPSHWNALGSSTEQCAAKKDHSVINNLYVNDLQYMSYDWFLQKEVPFCSGMWDYYHFRDDKWRYLHSPQRIDRFWQNLARWRMLALWTLSAVNLTGWCHIKFAPLLLLTITNVKISDTIGHHAT